MRTFKQRVARLAVAVALAAGLAFAIAPTLLAQRNAEDFTMTCVYYTETAGVCMSQTFWSDGTIETHTYWFWGNSYGQIT